MESYDLIIMVLASMKEPYLSIENRGVRETWSKLSCMFPDIKIIFYYGDSDTVHESGDRLFINTAETYENISYKTFLALEYVFRKHDSRHIF